MPILNNAKLSFSYMGHIKSYTLIARLSLYYIYIFKGAF